MYNFILLIAAYGTDKTDILLYSVGYLINSRFFSLLVDELNE